MLLLFSSLMNFYQLLRPVILVYKSNHNTRLHALLSTFHRFL
uniref:Uncharacterized protein n=1 Tax=Arundo donax TaxID=35708 RepID=A0A0A9C7H6_ARUDO